MECGKRIGPLPTNRESVMAHYDDLAPCTYFGRWEHVLLAIGWLEAGRPYRKGSVEREVLFCACLLAARSMATSSVGRAWRVWFLPFFERAIADCAQGTDGSIGQCKSLRPCGAGSLRRAKSDRALY